MVFDDVLMSKSHITRPTYFRLLLPDLLEEDKCIYLDTDTIVLLDLARMYNIDMGDCYVAGVRHPGVVVPCSHEFCKNIGIPSADQYINAGVLLMNLEKLRHDGMVKKFLELISWNMPMQDQDIINNACYGKILRIPFKYNVLTKLSDVCSVDYKNTYSETELREAWNRPAIIHYADLNKPWNSGGCAFADYWWKYFWKSPAYKCVINDFWNEFVINVIYRSCKNQIFAKKTPKMFDITFQRNYVIYGAGKRAKDVIPFIKQLGIVPEFIIVSSLEGNPSEIEGIEVKDIADAGGMLRNKTVIIAVREGLQREIINLLHGYDFMELLPISDDFKVG